MNIFIDIYILKSPSKLAQSNSRYLITRSNINQKLRKIVHKPGTIKLEKLTEIPNENIFRHR